MLIGLDFDGVIGDIVFLKQKYAKIMYGIELKPEECKRKIAAQKGINNEMYDKLGKHIYSTEAGLETPEIPDAVKYIKELQKNNEIRIVSSRLDNGLWRLKEWLKRRDLEIEIKLTGQKPKTEFVKGMEFFLDDDLKKLEEICDIVPFPCLLDSPYNKEKNNDKIFRVTWKDFYNLILKKQ